LPESVTYLEIEENFTKVIYVTKFNMPRSNDIEEVNVCIFGSDFGKKFCYQNVLFVVVSVLIVLIWVATITYAVILPLHYSAESISVEFGRPLINLETFMLSNVATGILFYFSRKYYSNVWIIFMPQKDGMIDDG